MVDIDSGKIRQRAVEIISSHLGESTAKLYNDFYKDKTPQEIRDSVGELLTEFFGEDVSQKRVDEMFGSVESSQFA